MRIVAETRYSSSEIAESKVFPASPYNRKSGKRTGEQIVEVVVHAIAAASFSLRVCHVPVRVCG